MLLSAAPRRANVTLYIRLCFVCEELMLFFYLFFFFFCCCFFLFAWGIASSRVSVAVKSAQQLAQAKFLLAYFSVFSVDRPANIPV